VLTNNKLTDKNKKEYYPEMLGDNPSLTISETAAVYTYEDGSPLKVGDSTNKKLSDGIGTEFMTTDGTNNSVIIYDLGADYYIAGIDVFSKFAYFAADKSMRWNMAGYSVEVSGDGTDYKCVATVKARTELLDDNTMGYEYEILKTPTVFPAVSARFVKITILADPEYSSQYNLDELVIKGFKSPFSRDDLYEALIKYSGVDKSVYTAESYENYLAAYNNATKVYWDSSASGLTVFNAKTELEEAYAALESNTKIVILSGNIVTDFDKTQYAGYSNDKLKGLSYKYIKFNGKDSNQEIADTDPSFSKLLQGNMSEYTSSSSLAFGKWDSSNPANILFNLGEECYVSGVDIWERYAGLATRAGKVSVYISNDGVDFEKVSETESTKADDETCANKIAQDFEPVKGRYLLVVAEKHSQAHQITLNEVVIKGFKTGQRDNIPFFIENTDYRTADGVRITSIDGAGEITVSGTAVSNRDMGGDVVVITAAYKDNDIVDWSFDVLNIDSYGSAEFENTIDLKGETGVKLLSFVWSSLEERIPLSRPKEFGSL
ncbi:MAG: discoidin domain-containing protein, partial [Clostridiales bacterium]|nr:discoidin domain-containing protein [Clostridiales bacterium]